MLLQISVLFYVFFCVILCIVCVVSFSVLFVCICVLYYCHQESTQLQLNISYHLRQEFQNSKFDIFELLVQKETFADAFLTGIVS